MTVSVYLPHVRRTFFKPGQQMETFLLRAILPVFWLSSFLLVSTFSYADEWKRAEPFSATSENQVYQLQVIPNRLDPIFSKDPSGNSARAKIIKKEGGRYTQLHEVKLVNNISPVRAFISNNGIFLTIDDYHHAGYEHSLVIYDSKGALLKDYSLEELLSAEELKHVTTSVSSRWWLEGPYKETSKFLFVSTGSHNQPEFNFKDEHTFVIQTGRGKVLSIDLRTGAIK